MSIIVHGVAQTGTSGTFTTPSFTSTGGGGLGVAGASSHAGTATLSDNKSNTWTKWVSQEQGTTGINPSVQLYYCEAPAVGTGHTLTVTGSGEFQCVEYAFLSDVLVHDGTNARGQVSPGGPTVAPGSTTPSAANAWLFTAAASSGGATFSIDASFSIIDQAGTIGGTAYGGAMASKTLTTASAQNPTWTADSFGSAVIGAFIPGGPSAQTVNPNAIATAESVYAPTVTGGGVSPLSVTPDAVATGEVVFAPTVNTTGSGWGYRAGSFAAQASGFSSSGASFTTTLTLGGAVLTGDRIIVAVYAVQSTSGAAPTYSLRDNVNGAGAAYTEDHTRTGTIASGGTQNLRHSVFSLANSAAGTPTITVTLTAGAGGGGTPIFGGVVAAAGNGLLTSDPGSDVKTGNSATSSSSASSGATGATTAANELVVGAYADAGFGVALAAGGGYTLRGEHENDGVNYQALLEDKDSGSSGTTQTATATPAGSVDWSMLVVVYKLGAGGGTPAQDTPELYGSPRQSARQMQQLLAQ